MSAPTVAEPSDAKSERFDLYQAVTDRIVEALERGVVPWRKPWKGAGSGQQMNLHSRRAYRGINQFLLTMSEYDSPYWLSMKQANSLGGNVRKGERSTIVVFWKQVRRKIKPGDTVQPGTRVIEQDGQRFAVIFLLRYYRVFNVEQIDGLPAGLVPEPDEQDEVPMLDDCEAILADYTRSDDSPDGPSFRERGDRAYYAPASDSIVLPPRAAFETVEAFYSTAFHECVHSTGHGNRLARKELMDGSTFGSEPYGREELVAEMGAAMLCAFTQIDTTPLGDQAAAYIGSWLNTIKGDKRLVISAAGRAQRAADLIIGEHAPEGEE